MAFLLCFTMMPMPAFATEANGENSADTSSTATPPTFDPSDTPTPASAEDESNNDGTENNDLASSGDQEEITIDDDSSDFIGEGETPDEPSSETVAKAAKLPAARGQLNVTVPTAFNFGGDSGYNVDLGAPEEGYLTSQGFFINKGTGIAQIEGLTCTDTGASSILVGANNKKVFGLYDSNNAAELRFGYTDGVNSVSLTEMTDTDKASFGVLSNAGRQLECRLYLNDGVTLNPSKADNGLSVQSLANVVFTVRALPSGNGSDTDNFYLKDLKTNEVFSGAEIKLHAQSIADLGPQSPFYNRYKSYIDADVNAVVAESKKAGTYFFSEYGKDGALIYKSNGTLETDESIVRQGRSAYKKHNSSASQTVSNSAYECKLKLDNNYVRLRIIGISNGNFSPYDKAGLVFESIDLFTDSSSLGSVFASWNTHIFAKWNMRIEEEAASSNQLGISLMQYKGLDCLPQIETNFDTGGLPAEVFVLNQTDAYTANSKYYFYRQVISKGGKLTNFNNIEWWAYDPHTYTWKTVFGIPSMSWSYDRFFSPISGSQKRWIWLRSDGEISSGSVPPDDITYCPAFML
jgi:hypothetical protein